MIFLLVSSSKMIDLNSKGMATKYSKMNSVLFFQDPYDFQQEQTLFKRSAAGFDKVLVV